MDWTVRSEALPLGDLLVRTAQRTPDAVALAFPEETFTYRDLFERSVEVSRGLLAAGVTPGDNVGVLAPNSIEYVSGMFGAALIGAVVVPLHVRSTSRELEYLVCHAELAVILTTDRIDGRANFRQRLGEALPGLADSDDGTTLALDSAPRLRRVVMLRGVSGQGCMGEAAFKRAAQEVPAGRVAALRARVRVRDAGFILYTSGTTSNPKGCVLSHEAITRGPMSRALFAFPFEATEPVVMWCAGPLFHIAAVQVFLYSIGTGGTFVTDVYVDGDRALASIKEWRATSLMGLFMPALRSLRAADGFCPDDLDFVTSIMTVGLRAELLEWQEMFPQAVLVNGIGMTETTGWYCMSPLDDTPEMRATTVGKPVPGAQLRIVDTDTGNEVPDGVRGELLVRTYTMLDEYFRDPERTAETIDSDGWVHTGDLFTRLPSGHYVFEGRQKDMLKVGGENVPAIEVENYLCTHPAVLSAEVVALPDPRLEEVPVAFVELVAGISTTEVELIEFCKGHLATFKVPRAVHFVSAGEWPMSASKINKVALREEAKRVFSLSAAGK